MACLRVVKRSQPYRKIHPRLVGHREVTPSEHWDEDGRTFFTFDLIPGPESSEHLSPFVLFVVENRQRRLLAALVVEPGSGALETKVRVLFTAYISQEAAEHL